MTDLVLTVVRTVKITRDEFATALYEKLPMGALTWWGAQQIADAVIELIAEKVKP